MAQLLRALVVLTEDPGSVHSIHVAAHKHSELQCQGIQHPLLPLQAPCLHIVHTHTAQTKLLFNIIRDYPKRV